MEEADEGDTPLPEVPEIDSCCAAAAVTVEVSTEEPVAAALGAAPVLQSILTSTEADAATATFSLSEWNLFYQGLVDSGNRYIAIAAVLEHREESLEELAMESSAAAVATHAADEEEEEEDEQVLTPDQLRSMAKEDAEAKVIEALASIDAAEKACGGLFTAKFKLAREKLQACTDPLAAGAAEAQRIIHNILMNCPCAKAEKALKKADRDVRDVVVLRCIALNEHPQDRDGFLELAAQAHGGELDKEVRAQLLLAYHKDARNQKCGFVSNNQVAADRRGGPRPRRRRHSPGDKKEANGDAADSSSHNQQRANTNGASASAGPSSASCAAALPDPAYVTVNPVNQPGFNGQAHMTTPPYQGQYNQYNMVAHPLPGHHQDGGQDCHTNTAYSDGKSGRAVGEPVASSAWAAQAVAPAAQEAEVFGPSGLLPHMDEEAAPGPDPRMPGRSTHQLPQPQAFPELGPTMNGYTDAAQGSMPYEMQYPPCQQYGVQFAPAHYTYDMNGYDMSAAYNQNAMMQSGMYGFQEDPSALQHPPTNQRHLPKGKGNGGQPQKGNGKGGKKK